MTGAAVKSVRERVLAVIVKELGLDDEPVDRETLKDDLGADSLDVVEIEMELQKEFNLVFEDDTYLTWVTVGDVVAAMEKANA